MLLAAVVLWQGCASSGGPGSTGGGGNPPGPPTGLAATAGVQQVSLSWTASSGATSYNVKRGTAHGGPYTTISSPSAPSYTDTGLTAGTTYFYVVSAVNANGESGNSAEVSAVPTAAGSAPGVPTGLKATAGVQQVSLSWTASSGATSYHVKRSTTHGGPYTTISSPGSTSYTDTGLTAGTTYYYVVSSLNANGESANSAEVSAVPTAAGTVVSVSIDVLSNRHSISPYVYGGAFPKDAATISDSGMSVVRWGGNAASTYNWQLGTDNADNDYFFEDYTFCGLGGYPTGGACVDSDSTQWVTDVKAHGSNPLLTMVMLPWVAQGAEQSTQQGNGSNNDHWVFSVSQDGACSSKVDPYNTDAGVNLQSDCTTTMVASPTQLNRAYFPLLDDHTQNCPVATCVYRNDWAAALATAFGSAPHFYDMDNEIDIWGGTHVDVHPNPAGYDELANVYLTEATKLKAWDPQAIRLGPVSCCWWFYWNGANGNDKGNHGGIDFLPWWLNQVYWQDQISGARSLDIFDIHAYPDGPDTSSYSLAQKQALAVSIYRDYWDPTLVSPSGTINQPWTTNIQPNKTIAFRIPRMRAIANTTYPGTPLAFTEWSAAFAGESDFSTALGDADAYGILGRERVYLASRWTAPDPTAPNPNYLALKLYTNYDGSHHGFGAISVADTNTGNPSLFSSYAALDSTGKTLTVVVLNKDPNNAAQAQFALNGFTATSFVSYTLASGAPTKITASSSQAWSATQKFAPYSATVLVIQGNQPTAPSSEWDLNPDTIMAPAGGTVTLQPKITSGTSNVNLSSAVFDSYEGVSACSGNIALTNAGVTTTQPGTITVTAGNTPVFCHFTVTGSDGVATQRQGGWIVVGNPAATLPKTAGDGQAGPASSQLPTALTVQLTPGQSGGSAMGASILFSASAGSLTSGSSAGAKVLAVTDSSGNASVKLTLPATTGSVTVTAEGPYGLGHPVATFTETSQ